MLHVLSGEWPFPEEAVRVNPSDPNDIVGLTEFDRREEYVNKIGDGHVLMRLIQSCLSNSSAHRPTSSEVHQQVSAVAGDHPPSFANRVEMLERMKALGEEKERAVAEKNDAITERDVAVREREMVSAELEETKTYINSVGQCHSVEVEKMQIEIADLKEDIECLHTMVSVKEHEIASKNALISSKSKTIQLLQIKLEQALGTSVIKNNLNVFSPGVKLTFTECTQLPISSFFGPAIVVGKDVYVGLYGESKVLKYSVIGEAWSTLPDTPVNRFSIGYLHKKLLLVGGQVMPSMEVTPNIHEFDEASQQWVRSTTVPPMPTARSSLTTVSWTSPPALIVCGGKDQQSQPLITVEVYHGRMSQWYTASPLPSPRDSMTHAVVNGALFLVCGYQKSNLGSSRKTVMSAPIPQLLESCLRPSNTPPIQWQIIPDVPYYCSTATSLGGCLLVVGGSKNAYDSPVSLVHAYCPSSSSWVVVGELPQPLCDCITATLPTGELLVMGGWSASGAQSSATYKSALVTFAMP